MTMRTRFPLQCECGHTGSIRMRENDQPFSKMYESYSLEGFEGGSYSVDGYCTLSEAVNAMKPKCPECGKIQSL